MKKLTLAVMIVFLLVSALEFTVNVQPVKASEEIYIRDDGRIEPATANITTADNVTYVFTSDNYASIVVERNNIAVDGNGFTLQGPGNSGFDLSLVHNVTIRNTTIREFGSGIWLDESSYNYITGNTLLNNGLGIYLYTRCNNNTIRDNIVAHGSAGIETHYSSNNTIADNLFIENTFRAFHIDDGSNFNCILRNNLTDNAWGIYLDHGSNNNVMRNNTISGSYVNFGVHIISLAFIIQDIDPSNTVDGKPIYYLINHQDATVPSDAGYVALIACTNMTVEDLVLRNNFQGLLLHSTQNSTIRNNTMINNGLAITIGYSSNNFLFRNSFINNSFMYIYGESTNTWDDGYPAGGNYWSDYTGEDFFKGPYQNETGCDGIGDTPRFNNNDDSNTDNYPLMKRYQGPCDIGVTEITPLKTVVGQGFSMNTSITILNYGINLETINITIYANITILQTRIITLSSRNSTTLTFNWTTAHFVWGNYTFRVVAEPVPGEVDTIDNNVSASVDVCVTLPGNIDADTDVDIFDIVKLAEAYGTETPDPQYNSNCDIDNDGDVDIFDIVIAASHYGESW